MAIFKVQRFQLDKNLAYLIQATTGETTNSIMDFFVDMAHYVIVNALEEQDRKRALGKKVVNRMNKNITLLYRETSIPFRIHIASSYLTPMSGGKPLTIYVSIAFPKSISYVDFAAEIANQVEVGLGLLDDTNKPIHKPFDKPRLQAPKSLQKLRKEQSERLKQGK